MLPGGSASAQTAANYHASADRSGNYTVPGLTWERARTLRQDAGFSGQFRGRLYAQPLYWQPPGSSSGIVIVASESNTVAALDAENGRTVWTRYLGTPAPRAAFPCGNIDPLGITGTPVIDPANGTLYLDAMVLDASGPRHQLVALSLADGSIMPGWPIDLGEALRAIGQSFDSDVQNQRGALALLGHTLYVPYGGFFGDCGDYHGWVVGVPLGDPHRVIAWRTRGRGGGIWAPGGIASDGESLYVATGNTVGAAQWADGEAVFRLAPDLPHSGGKTDFFAPADWRRLDGRDADLGGTNPLPLTIESGRGAQRLLLALGKDRHAYLLDPLDLGGLGANVVAEPVAAYAIRTAPAAFPDGGAAVVAFQGRGAHCPAGQRGDLTVLRITGTPPAIATAWCGMMSGAGAPIVTTSDGRSDPVVWITGAEGDNRLHGFRGDTGEPLFTGQPLAGLRHFGTPLAAAGKLFVGADNRVYAFAPAP